MFGYDVKGTDIDKFDEAAIRIVVRTTGILSGKRDEDAINDLTSVAIGDMLFQAVATVSEMDHIEDKTFENDQKKMEQVSIYLDTGVVFRAFGFLGVEREEAAGELLSMMKETGCRLNVFEHTLNEMQESIYAVAERLGTKAYGPLVNWSIENSKDSSDLLEIADSLSENLAEIGINVVDRPRIREELTLDENKLDWQIESEVKQDNQTARLRDIDSLTSIFRLREGEPKKTLESCDALFVTTNKSLSRASDKYFREHFKSEGQKNIAQICMTDVVLASRLWVKLPTSFANVPQQTMISHALSSLRVDKDLKDNFDKYLDSLVQNGKLKDKEAAILKLSAFTRQLLAVQTNRRNQEIDRQEADNIITAVLNEDRRKKQNWDKQKKQYMYDLEAESTRAVQAEELSEKQREEYEKLQRNFEDALAAYRVSKKLTEQIVKWIFVVIAFVFLVFIFFISLQPFLTDLILDSVWAKLIGSITSLILAVLTMFGASLLGFNSWLSRRLQPRIEGFVRNLLMDDEVRRLRSADTDIHGRTQK